MYFSFTYSLHKAVGDISPFSYFKNVVLGGPRVVYPLDVTEPQPEPSTPAAVYNPTTTNAPPPFPYSPVNVLNSVLPQIYQSDAPTVGESSISSTSTKAQFQYTSASTGSTDYLVYPPLGTPPPEPSIPESVDNENEPEATKSDEPNETGNNQVYRWRQLPQTGSAQNQGPTYNTVAQPQGPTYNTVAQDQSPIYNSVAQHSEQKTKQNYVPTYVTYSSSYSQPSSPPPPPSPVEESSPAPPIFYFQGVVKEQASDASREVEEPVPDVQQIPEEPAASVQPDPPPGIPLFSRNSLICHKM